MQINQTVQQQRTREPCIVTIGAKDTNVPTFEAIVIPAIDATLSSLENKQEIYRLLEAKYGISLLDIADNPEAFEAALKDMFGEASLLIEMSLIRNLHYRAPKFCYHLGKNQELTLSSYLYRLKHFLA
jgi:hypothetical protein